MKLGNPISSSPLLKIGKIENQSYIYPASPGRNLLTKQTNET